MKEIAAMRGAMEPDASHTGRAPQSDRGTIPRANLSFSSLSGLIDNKIKQLTRLEVNTTF